MGGCPRPDDADPNGALRGYVAAMPFGYLAAVVLFACSALLALAPPRRPRALASIGFRLGLAINELPHVAFLLLLVSTIQAFAQGDIDSAGAWAVVGLAIATAVVLAAIAMRGSRAAQAVGRALDDGLGAGWRAAIDPAIAARLRRRLPYARIALRPFFARRRDVERTSNIGYGDAGKRNRLDVYRHRSHPPGGPTLIHLHGGRFVGGRKNSQSLPLLYRLASQGWTCVSANYRLKPAARFPDHLIDVKKAIAWVREHGPQHGADPAVLFVAGSSAGAHLASMAALTPNDPRFQPGFEDVDTTVAAAIGLGGYYGPLDGDDSSLPSSPAAYVGPHAPPFFLAHGDRDTVVRVEGARRFAESLRRTGSSSPVVYAELPGAQHAFDLFHSVRFETVVDGIEAFAAWVRST